MTDTATQDRLDWLQWRREGLGASDIAGVLGLSPWASPYSVWADKRGLTPDPDLSEAMWFGRMAEPMLANMFEERTGLYAGDAQTRVERPDAPWMRCTIDGLAYESHAGLSDPSCAIAAIEYKTTRDSPAAWEPDVPVHYACQATWTAVVTGKPVVIFGVLHFPYNFRTYTFQPSPDDVALVQAQARIFWNGHVLTGQPPAVDGSEATADALAAIYPRQLAGMDSVEATPDLVTAVERIKTNQRRIDACQKIIREQKNLIEAAIGDHAALTHGVTDKGKPRVLATWKEQHRAAYVVAESAFRVLRVK